MPRHRPEDHHYQLIGLAGFILAGVIFVVVGIRSDDMLTIVGSVIWIVACIIWLIPLRHRDSN